MHRVVDVLFAASLLAGGLQLLIIAVLIFYPPVSVIIGLLGAIIR